MPTPRRPTRRLGLHLAVGLTLAVALGACATVQPPPSIPTPSAVAPALTPVPGGSTPGPTAPAPATPPPVSESASPGATASKPPPVPAVLACEGTDVSFPSTVLGSAIVRLDDSPAGKALLAYIDAVGVESGMQRDGWRLVVATPDTVTFLESAGDAWAIATVARLGDGSWDFFEGGACTLAPKTPAGVGFATWELDPATPPAPDATRLSIQAREQACANGDVPGDRVLAPVVEETATTVTITVLVRRLENADCPSSPAFPMEITLAAPLGSRTLLDGSRYPPQHRS